MHSVAPAQQPEQLSGPQFFFVGPQVNRNNEMQMENGAARMRGFYHPKQMAHQISPVSH
jgi:hypothetical protein